MESTLLSVLFLAAVSLLFLVTGGIAYLTTIEWRDRRRQSSESRKR